MAQQQREPLTSVVQSRLIKINEAVKKLTPEDAKYLQRRAVAEDLHDAAKKIEDLAK